MRKNNRADCSKEGGLTPDHNAAYDFVDSMIKEQVDGHDTSGCAMWYGWALREAFLAGVEYARKK